MRQRDEAVRLLRGVRDEGECHDEDCEFRERVRHLLDHVFTNTPKKCAHGVEVTRPNSCETCWLEQPAASLDKPTGESE